MLVWHKTHSWAYEARVGDATLATVWYDEPLLFNKKSATWRGRTTFSGVGVRGFGQAFGSLEEAQEGMGNFIKAIAEAILKD